MGGKEWWKEKEEKIEGKREGGKNKGKIRRSLFY